jgi:hypothetical protein
MKILALVAVAVLVGSAAEAAPRRKAAPARTNTYDSYQAPRAMSSSGGQRMAGCGLGSMVVETNDTWSQVAAAFLNGTGFQTFAISFGTSNCTEDGVASASREKEAFVEANIADLRRDVAIGEGEYLSSLASFYGCEGEKADIFGAALQRNQDRLDVSGPEASRVIDSLVAQEAVGCNS